MEKSALEKRIEERATNRLLKYMLDMSEKEREVCDFICKEKSLQVHERYSDYSRKNEIILRDDYTKSIFKANLPRYIEIVTDELLAGVDEMNWLRDNPGKSLDD